MLILVACVFLAGCGLLENPPGVVGVLCPVRGVYTAVDTQGITYGLALDPLRTDMDTGFIWLASRDQTRDSMRRILDELVQRLLADSVTEQYIASTFGSTSGVYIFSGTYSVTKPCDDIIFTTRDGLIMVMSDISFTTSEQQFRATYDGREIVFTRQAFIPKPTPTPEPISQGEGVSWPDCDPQVFDSRWQLKPSGENHEGSSVAISSDSRSISLVLNGGALEQLQQLSLICVSELLERNFDILLSANDQGMSESHTMTAGLSLGGHYVGLEKVAGGASGSIRTQLLQGESVAQQAVSSHPYTNSVVNLRFRREGLRLYLYYANESRRWIELDVVDLSAMELDQIALVLTVGGTSPGAGTFSDVSFADVQ